jgi:hypothetical protein
MKPLDEILEPDARHAVFMTWGEYGELRQSTFEDHYAMAASLKLPSGLPANVERSWDRALNCLVYAWFDYELMILAESQALMTADLALKQKLAFPEGKGPLGFRGRLKEAVARGLLQPSFSHGDWPNDHDLLSDLRNDLMHGSEQVHDPNIAFIVFTRLRALICELHGTPVEQGGRSSRGDFEAGL